MLAQACFVVRIAKMTGRGSVACCGAQAGSSPNHFWLQQCLRRPTQRRSALGGWAWKPSWRQGDSVVDPRLPSDVSTVFLNHSTRVTREDNSHLSQMPCVWHGSAGQKFPHSSRSRRRSRSRSRSSSCHQACKSHDRKDAFQIPFEMAQYEQQSG